MLLLNFQSQIAAQNYIYFLYLQNFPLFFIENESEIVSLRITYHSDYENKN